MLITISRTSNKYEGTKNLQLKNRKNASKNANNILKRKYNNFIVFTEINHHLNGTYQDNTERCKQSCGFFLGHHSRQK